MTRDIAEQLRSMPDLEPPADIWAKIMTKRAGVDRGRWGRGLAVAAAIGLALIGGYWTLQSPGLDAAPVVQPIMVSAPVSQRQSDVGGDEAQVRALQRHSQRMERVLGELPQRGRVIRADTAGVIAELEDRIAAVDYQLNQAGVNRGRLTGRGGEQRQRGRSLQSFPGSAARGSPGYQRAGTRDLWRQRVEFMDQLVRAHYIETGSNGL